ncbi:coiled-coil domain-containing protein 22-like [Apteryx rowi]|uniref:coiled-coil domain-containing protein 22-like n=1 Tax=Apteryx rowi TaxID=308060 RepID=UPI000E1DF739|nr:coiled-coil domain-containing protein 22-like [Apteryx rowi]
MCPPATFARLVPPEIQSVRDFPPELVVEAAVRCVRVVRPALGAPLSTLLPPGMSARFRLASDLASACQELGFGGDVGYQTFLYSSEHDTRRLLLFLVEKLPRDEAGGGAEPPGKSGALLRAIGACIRDQLGTPWVPPNCRTPRLQRLQGTSYLQPFSTCPLVLPHSGGPPGRAQLESSRRLSEIRALHERSRSAADEARRKEELYKQLVLELEALPRDVSRAVYTRRILEIVGNIRKQKEEIGKILVDTRALQKEINALAGKLERTFSVTDELLFKDAKRDEVVRKAYKYLAALHEVPGEAAGWGGAWGGLEGLQGGFGGTQASRPHSPWGLGAAGGVTPGMGG